ncbi:MAG TPA: aldehyde ferredoxin oxidoreductase N-terminal domain-containing protein, partial [Chloroflexota bacterium]|nr:aldehyde ferredoxin oxidoreductase N-terminal domain-containing protein [Chloroflexota bacterium]
MAYGYTGKILRLNLTTGTISVDEHDDLWYRRYLGGAGIAAYYLLNET